MRSNPAVVAALSGDFDRVALMTACREREVEPAVAQFVLAQLAAMTKGDGLAYPSAEHLAEQSDLTPRHVRRALGALADAGLAVKIGYRHRARLRHVLPDLTSGLTQDEGGQGQTRTRDGAGQRTKDENGQSGPDVDRDIDRRLDRDLGRHRSTKGKGKVKGEAPPTCPKHPRGNPTGEPCGGCADVRKATASRPTPLPDPLCLQCRVTHAPAEDCPVECEHGDPRGASGCALCRVGAVG